MMNPVEILLPFETATAFGHQCHLMGEVQKL